MANYTATTRTSYFRVDDKKRYQKLMKGLVSNRRIR